MQTESYRTQTCIMDRANTGHSAFWPIGVDIGYSSTKVLSPSRTAQFPSYAERLTGGIAGTPPASFILYKDLETGEEWVVGAEAQNGSRRDGTNAAEQFLFGRDRYRDPMFAVLIRTALGLGLHKNVFGAPDGKKVVVESGLPPAYLPQDTDFLTEAFAGRHHFSLRVGNGKTEEFDVTLKEADIDVIAQPMGTLYSVMVDRRGRYISGYREYLSKNVLVFDAGFGTLDLFSIHSHRLGDSVTLDDMGMKAVLKGTLSRLSEMKAHYNLVSLQKALETGTVTVHDAKARTSKRVGFADILEEESRKVCLAALDKTFAAFPPDQLDTLIITGGTSDAWQNWIREELKGYETLTVVPGNLNDRDLSLSFANARGYYYHLYTGLNHRGG